MIHLGPKDLSIHRNVDKFHTYKMDLNHTMWMHLDKMCDYCWALQGLPLRWSLITEEDAIQALIQFLSASFQTLENNVKAERLTTFRDLMHKIELMEE